MTTILIATQPDEVQNTLPWARCLAECRGDSLAVVLPQRKKGDARRVELPEAPADGESDLIQIARKLASPPQPSEESDSTPEYYDQNTLTSAEPPETELTSQIRYTSFHQILGEDWTVNLPAHIQELKPTLLVLPAPATIRENSQEADWQATLMAEMDCEVMLIQDDAQSFESQIRVGVLISDDTDHETSLRHAVQLVQGFGGLATAVFVEQNVGDLAATVGRRRLDDLLRRNVSRDHLPLFHRRVLVASHPAEALTQLRASEFDLLLLGTDNLRQIRRFLAASPAREDAAPIPAVAVIRRGATFSGRIWNRCDSWIRSFIPQLSREDRVDLVARIQNNSKWDFDFVLLISLATLIACLGLAENSGAVIVGAMLVAPLMTPIAGVGLGVAHANSFLTRVALRTALRGFVTAIIIGVLFGLFVRTAASFGWLMALHLDAVFPEQMENRMRPQFYDLLIALASGVAAAYAMGRPNLFSALPGVAIAAALVPPIATSGIAFAHGQLLMGGGALLLFLTNMVTIILGATIVFRAVGIRSQKEGPNAARWPRYALLLLVILSILSTVFIELHQRSSAP